MSVFSTFFNLLLNKKTGTRHHVPQGISSAGNDIDSLRYCLLRGNGLL